MFFWMYPDWFSETPSSGTAAGPSATAGNDPEHTVDQRLLDEVSRALLSDPAVTDGTIEVNVQNGVAILDGDIGSPEARTAAMAAAASVPGVRDVCDVLFVTGTSHRR